MTTELWNTKCDKNNKFQSMCIFLIMLSFFASIYDVTIEFQIVVPIFAQIREFRDPHGQEGYHSLGSPYYRHADGVLLVYDITRYEMFASLSS